MANENLKGKKVAILVTDGFEQVELLQPREALDKAGAETKVVSPKDGPVKGWDMTNWGNEVPSDLTLDRARPQDFDALLLPGGVINPDKLRIEPKAVAFVKSFFRRRQTRCGNLPRPMDHHRSRCGSRPQDRFMAFAQDRPAECRGRVDR